MLRRLFLRVVAAVQVVIIHKRRVPELVDVEGGEAAHRAHALHVHAVEAHVLQDAVCARREAEAQDERREYHGEGLLREERGLVLEKPQEGVTHEGRVAAAAPRVREVVRVRRHAKHELLGHLGMAHGLQLRRRLARRMLRGAVPVGLGGNTIAAVTVRPTGRLRDAAHGTRRGRVLRQAHLGHEVVGGMRVYAPIQGRLVLALLLVHGRRPQPPRDREGCAEDAHVPEQVPAPKLGVQQDRFVHEREHQEHRNERA
mmetsp:Transcript_36760/g.115119  ORF Transcript_36760/g.115119 Transcript_36760/m.115119 type:complete len:257 (-) Transcript_36760:1610-2380(-)